MSLNWFATRSASRFFAACKILEPSGVALWTIDNSNGNGNGNGNNDNNNNNGKL